MVRASTRQLDVQLVALLEGQISFLKGLADSERARADRLQEVLLALAKAHTAVLERQARPGWRRLGARTPMKPPRNPHDTPRKAQPRQTVDE